MFRLSGYTDLISLQWDSQLARNLVGWPDSRFLGPVGKVTYAVDFSPDGRIYAPSTYTSGRRASVIQRAMFYISGSGRFNTSMETSVGRRLSMTRESIELCMFESGEKTIFAPTVEKQFFGLS